MKKQHLLGVIRIMPILFTLMDLLLLLLLQLLISLKPLSRIKDSSLVKTAKFIKETFSLIVLLIRVQFLKTCNNNSLWYQMVNKKPNLLWSTMGEEVLSKLLELLLKRMKIRIQCSKRIQTNNLKMTSLIYA